MHIGDFDEAILFIRECCLNILVCYFKKHRYMLSYQNPSPENLHPNQVKLLVTGTLFAFRATALQQHLMIVIGMWLRHLHFFQAGWSDYICISPAHFMETT
jgi:hypothetical protein